MDLRFPNIECPKCKKIMRQGSVHCVPEGTAMGKVCDDCQIVISIGVPHIGYECGISFIRKEDKELN